LFKIFEKMNPFLLTGQVALITGASKGIGLAIAEYFAAAGAKVVISSRDQPSLDILAAELNIKGYDVTGIACHVGKMDALEVLVQKTIERYGALDILVNNAATNPMFGPIHDTSLEAFDKIMQVNLKAPFQLMRLCLPYLKVSSNASVINISSVGGISPEAGLGIYSVSKAALISMTKAFAKEWGGMNIRVNAICPGLIKTKFSEALWTNEAILNHTLKALPFKRMGSPEEIAAAALYLASPQAQYTTGSVITADGGLTI
jgi:NAD(P)-dependent dehydrogenase (short-subunit alcohol dehydrogenase family)